MLFQKLILPITDTIMRMLSPSYISHDTNYI